MSCVQPNTSDEATATTPAALPVAEAAEAVRMEVLSRLEIFDKERDSALEDLAELAALTFGAPMAAISLITTTRQWFKARIGFELEEASREHSFCAHTEHCQGVLEVPDAAKDPRFRDNPLVRHGPQVRFYAGAPLITPEGHWLGALCVIDVSPRSGVTETERRKLQALAATATELILQRAAARQRDRFAETAAEKSEMLALAEQAAQIGTWVYDVHSDRLEWSDETFRICGLNPDDGPPAPQGLFARFAPADAKRLRQLVDRSISQACGYENRARIRRPDGAWRHIASRAFHRCDDKGEVVALYGTVQDVSELRQADVALKASAKRLRSLNRALTAYARSTTALLHHEGLEPIFADVCSAIVEDKTYPLAMVALAEPDVAKSVKVVAQAGRAVGYLNGLALSYSDRAPEGLGPTGVAIRNRSPIILRDMRTEPSFTPWRARAADHGLRSSVTVPIFRNDTVSGVLVVYASRPDAFAKDELSLFRRLADELALAMALEEGREELASSQRLRLRAEALESAARRDLVESESRYRLLAESIPDIIVRYDTQGFIEFISPAVRSLGLDPTTLVGRHISVLAPQAKGGSHTLAALLEGAPLPAGRNNEWRLRSDRGELWLQGHPAAIRDATGTPVGIVTVIRDVTERRALEEELRQKRAEAEAALDIKAQFLANMSHEIRTPLTGVLGFASLLSAMDGLSQEARRYVDRISAGGQALLSVVNDILDFSRLEAGRVELDLQPHNPLVLLEEACNITSAQATAKGLELKFERPSAVPAGVLIDSGRVRQVLLNLLGNAIKFTDAGTVTLSCGYDHTGDGRLRIEVTDTGIGIRTEDARQLFRRFSQVDGSNTRQYGGAGLGLAISKGLVDLMGGDIGVDSEIGRGSRFWFSIPAPVAELRPQSASVDNGPISMEPLQVLVVDDVAANRELIRAMLAQFDVKVTEACNGQEAVEAAMGGRFDLILMDLQMPGMDGLAATRAIRANAELNRATPILAVSANVMPSQIEASRIAGMNDHIGKPIDPGDLLTKIAAWCDSGSGDTGLSDG